MRHTARYLLAVALLAAGSAPARADAPPEALAALGAADNAFHARTCGLVLLSAGRAQVRLEKLKSPPAYGPAMGQLIAAFMLLRDGEKVVDRAAARAFFSERLSTRNSTRPAQQALPEATAHCSEWFNARSRQVDFDLSEDAKWSAMQQAQLTLQSE